MIIYNGTFIRNNYRIFHYDFFSFETISNLNNNCNNTTSNKDETIQIPKRRGIYNKTVY